MALSTLRPTLSRIIRIVNQGKFLSGKQFSCSQFSSLTNSKLSNISICVLEDESSLKNLPLSTYANRSKRYTLLNNGIRNYRSNPVREFSKNFARSAEILDKEDERMNPEKSENPTGLDNDENVKEREARRKKMEKSTRLGVAFILFTIGLSVVLFIFEHGFPEKDVHGIAIPDEFTDTGPMGVLRRSYSALISYYLYLKEPSREKLLPDPIPEIYQPKYTLVMEMTEVLVHPEWSYNTGWRFKKRPAVDYFLEQLRYPNFEVVIFTNESGMTGTPIVDSLEGPTPQNEPPRIMYRLYKDTTKFDNGHHIKDLSKLNRDLRRVIYIDWDPNAFRLHPENALRVPPWDGNDDDTSLVDLAELLKTIASSNVDDVREIVQFYSQFDDPAKEFRYRKMMAVHSQLDAQAKDSAPVKNYAGRLFGYKRH